MRRGVAKTIAIGDRRALVAAIATTALVGAGCDLFSALNGGAGLKCFEDENCPAGLACVEHLCQASDAASDAARTDGDPGDDRTADATVADVAARDGAARDGTGSDNGVQDRGTQDLGARDHAASDTVVDPCGNDRLDPGEACDGETGCDPDCHGCAGGVDHGGIDLTVTSAEVWSGLHCNIDQLTVVSGGAVHVVPHDGVSGGALTIAARSIVVEGFIDAAGAGYGGGGGGGGDNYFDSRYCDCGPGCAGGRDNGDRNGVAGGAGTLIWGHSHPEHAACIDEPGAGLYTVTCCEASAGGAGGGAGGRPGNRGAAIVQGGGPFRVEVGQPSALHDLVSDSVLTLPFSTATSVWRYDDQFAVAVGPAGLAVQDRGQFGLETVPGIPATTTFLSVIGSDPYHIWVGTDDGLYSWDRSSADADATPLVNTRGSSFDRLTWFDSQHLAAIRGTNLVVVNNSYGVVAEVAGSAPTALCVGLIATASQQLRTAAFMLQQGSIKWIERSTNSGPNRSAQTTLPFTSTPRACFVEEGYPGDPPVPTFYAYRLWVGTEDGSIYIIEIDTDAALPQAVIVDSFLHGTSREISATPIDAFAYTHDDKRWWTLSHSGVYALWTQSPTPTSSHHEILGGVITALFALPYHERRGGMGAGPWGGLGGGSGRYQLPFWCTTTCVPEPGLPGHPGGYLAAEVNGDDSGEGTIAVGSGGGGGGGGQASRGWCQGVGSGGAGGVAGTAGILDDCASGAGGSGGGAGGGAIRLHAEAGIVVSATGTVAADGAGDAALNAGYGAGGGIELMARSIAVAGAIRSLGGNSQGSGTTANGGTVRLVAPVRDLTSAAISAGRIYVAP